MARIRIADMEVGNSYTAPLAVVSATSRKTRAGKDYLTMTLFDGTSSITCNYWDWSGESMPEINKVYDFKVDCTEYNGTKQLTCRKVLVNTSCMVEDFLPQGPYDVAEAYKEFYSLVDGLKDDFYRELGLHILDATMDLWINVPAARSIHHNYMGGTLIHCLSVGKLSKLMAENIDGAWVDLATIGGLFHDIGKLFSYKIDGLSIDYTEDGQLLDHVFIGAELVGNMSEQFIRSEFDELKIQMLRHVILSHHMRLEYGSPVTPKCIEAWIVAHCDGLDATCETIRAECAKVSSTARFTEKIWSAGNTPHFTIQAMEALSKKPHIVGAPDSTSEWD